MKYITTIGGKEYTIEILDESHVRVDGELYAVDFVSIAGQPVFSLLVDGQSYEAYVYLVEQAWQVLLRGRAYTAQVEDEREKRLRAASVEGLTERAEFHLKAPMPGMVVSVPVEEGQAVREGEVLVVLESMKMQNELRSPRTGTVVRLRIDIGDSVEQNETMLSVV
jgi:biotin carboxyl carrier protein